MKLLARVLAFGCVSGVAWSIIAGGLTNSFTSRSEVLSTIAAGIFSGVVTSLVFAGLVAKAGRGITAILGLLSLPFGAFVFGFTFVAIGRFLYASTAGSPPLVAPATRGFEYAVLSVISVFAIGLFPLAVFTTLLLRSFVVRVRSAELAPS